MKTLFFGLALLASTTAIAQSPSPTPSAAPPKIRVHSYTAASRSYDVNAFWLESDQGLVLIDAMLLKSDARLLAAAMKATGKPLAGILLTHPHLDHFGGIRTVVSAFGSVPVYATRATIDGIKPTNDRALADGWPQRYGADYDQVPFIPNITVESGATLELAGMRFVVKDYGPMEAANNSVIHNIDLNILFTGDATVFHAGVYLGEGRSRATLDVLHRLAKDFAGVRRAFSGHYAPAAIGPLTAQNIDDVRYYRGVVSSQLADPAALTGKGELTEGARTRAARLMAMRMREGATYGMDAMSLASMNVAGLEAEMLGEVKRTPISPAGKAVLVGLRKVDFVLGRWEGTVSLPPTGAATAPTESKPANPDPSIVRFALGPGSRSIEGDTRVGGYGYRMVLSYDTAQEIYRFSSIDDVSGLLDIYEGGFDAAGALVVSNVKSGTHYVAGSEKIHNRLSFRPLSKDTWEWRVEGSKDGGKTWTLWQIFAAERRVP